MTHTEKSIFDKYITAKTPLALLFHRSIIELPQLYEEISKDRASQMSLQIVLRKTFHTILLCLHELWSSLIRRNEK